MGRGMDKVFMSAARTLTLINSWETTRYELLNTRVCDLGVRIEGSPLERYLARVLREFEAKGLRFEPQFYLSDSWGCPDEVPAVGIPFYLADSRLIRIEEEQTGEVEDDQMLMMLLRHEAGHAINYAYRLWERDDWADIFGKFSRPYRDRFQPNPSSREFVRHIMHSQYGRNYAQKHPDEDFAETFAVWLTPRSSWRRRYRQWPALRKLRYMDSLMRYIRTRPPRVTGGKLVNPVEDMDMLLAVHYGQRAERYRAAAQGYVDDKLREIFPEVRGRDMVAAAELLARNQEALRDRVARWSGLAVDDVNGILTKLTARAQALGLELRHREAPARLMDLTALATALAMDFAYTGRFVTS